MTKLQRFLILAHPKNWFYRKLGNPHPISICWVLCIYSWGWDLYLPKYTLVKSPEGMYLSPDATPNAAVLWIYHTPRRKR
jgi:hypothetical protein